MSGTKLNFFIQGDSEKCIGCKICEIACSVAHDDSMPTTAGAMKMPIIPRLFVVHTAEVTIPIQCHHCEDAPCARVCQVSAISLKNQKVLIEPERCIGCKLCIMACPFGAIEIVPQYREMQPIYPRPGQQDDRGGKKLYRASKCDLCVERPSGPACVEACPQRALQKMNPLAEVKQRNIEAAHDLLECIRDYCV